MRLHHLSLATLVALPLITGCSLKRMAIDQTAEVLVDGAGAFYEEEDYELANAAGAANIKILEGFLYAAPDNENLINLTAQAMGSYAFGFLETQAEELRFTDEQQMEHLQKRARGLYLRGKNIAARLLPKKVIAAAEQGSLEEFAKLLEELDDPGPLFWFGYNWGSAIQLSLDDPNAVAQLPKVEAMMARVKALDETFYFGGPHLFYGIFWAGRPKMLGGDPQKGKMHFEKAIEITGGKLLMPKLFMARFYAVATLDEDLYRSLLKEIIDAPADLWPEQRLANEIARRRAKVLLENIDEYM